MTRLGSGHKAIIAVVALVGLILLAIFVTPSQDASACQAWQERYRAAPPPPEGSGTLATINIGPLAELKESRPEGCPIPD